MAPSQPSTNWLKLQKKTSRGVAKGTKKTKVKRKTLIEKITDGLDTKVKKDAESLKQWAEDNDIPVNDVNDAYDLPRVGIEDTKLSSQKKTVGRYLAIDCEFVGVGKDGEESALARVSIVNFHGHTIYDEYVKPRERVTDWRTWVSGVTPAHMQQAIDFKTAQKDVSDLLKDKVLVGHAVDHDLDALMLSHPKSQLRDTSKFPPYRQLAKGKTPALKKLAKELLNIEIQGAEHSSVEDAQATMQLYKLEKKEFEKLYQRFHRKE